MLMTFKFVSAAADAGYAVRHETFDGRDHIVVPVTALVEGVIQASNAPNPEFVPASEFGKVPSGWNGRPIFVNHPEINGQPVSANSPALLDAQRVGTVFNTKAKTKKLTMEAWIDSAKLQAIDPDLHAKILAGQPIEVSVGAFVETDDTVGLYNGTQYIGEWSNIVPDHLAVLPAGVKGACSVEMGCGIRANSYRRVETNMKTARVISQEERDKIPAEDFAGKDKSFPIAVPGDVHDAAASIGRAGDGNYSTDELKARIIAIAYRKGADFVAQLPENWKKKSGQKAASILESRLSRVNRAVYAEDYGDSDTDKRVALEALLRTVEPRLYCVEDVYPDRVVYSVDESAPGIFGPLSYYQRAYTASGTTYTLTGDRSKVVEKSDWVPAPTAAAGARHSANDLNMIQQVHDYAAKLGATCTAPTTARAAGCGCGGHGKPKVNAKTGKW